MRWRRDPWRARPSLDRSDRPLGVRGLLLRVGGAILALAGTAGLALTGDPEALLAVAIGAALWFVGHWHFALRHHEYKSPLARYVFCRWAPARLDPTRGWAVAVAEEAAGHETGGRRPAG